MASIIARKRRDGTTGYTAQIRVRRDGETLYQEAKTFDRRQAASAWADRREKELDKPGALEAIKRGDPPLKDVIDTYIKDAELVRPIGRTKKATLERIAKSSLGLKGSSTIASESIVGFARERIADGASPATVKIDISHLSAVFSIAEAAWNLPLRHAEIDRAKKAMRKLGLTSTSRRRSRRPTLDELDGLMKHFFKRLVGRPESCHMPKVVAFAIFSTRRQEEICNITWSDLVPERQSVIVRDMKHPSDKIGNDTECYLTDEAWKIIHSMPRVSDRIFPYTTDAVRRAFGSACSLLGIKDLHFHDLRHEGVSRLFEMNWDIPRVSSVSGHRDWNSLRRYTHLRGHGDKYDGWVWLEKVLAENQKIST